LLERQGNPGSDKSRPSGNQDAHLTS
jgi:hypothetical protein